MESINRCGKSNYWLLTMVFFAVAPAFAAQGAGNEVEPVVFLRPELSGEQAESAAVHEKCAIESSLQNAIRERVDSIGAKIEFADDEAAFGNAKRQLYVTILEVDANWWRTMAVRPSSKITLVVRIDVDGHTVKSVRKVLGTGMAFTACDRIDHIAEGAAKFVVAWTTKVQARL